MATLQLSQPPDIPDGKAGDYVPWLLENHFDRICCYCLLTQTALEIEHFVPRNCPGPNRVNDPLNLLYACRKCNRGKSDYHPDHVNRTRSPHATHGHMVLDPRSDDYASHLRVLIDGTIEALEGESHARVAWHIGLIFLDLPCRDRLRLKRLKLRDAAEKTLVTEGLDDIIRNTVLNLFASCLMFYELLGITVTDALIEEARTRRQALLEAAVASGDL